MLSGNLIEIGSCFLTVVAIFASKQSLCYSALHSGQKDLSNGVIFSMYKKTTVNPQKIVRLSFSTLVFWVRRSFEVFGKMVVLGNFFVLHIKALALMARKLA